MNREQLTEQFYKLLKANEPMSEINRLVNRAITCGALYIEGESEDSLRLCKIIYYAVLCELCDHWKPSDRQHIREANNLRLFL